MNSSTVSVSSVKVAQLISAVAAINGQKFVGFTYRNADGELARHVVMVGIDYNEATKRSLETLQKRMPEFTGIDAEAARELVVSYSKTLLAEATNTPHPDNTKPDYYASVCPGLRITVGAKTEDGSPDNTKNGMFNVWGLTVSKKVIEAVPYAKVNSSAKTLAKKAIEKTLPRGKFRQFNVSADALQSVRIGGNEIELQDA